jgi:1-acyl-sn-glycerol-3-phosphate acyltransferase
MHKINIFLRSLIFSIISPVMISMISFSVFCAYLFPVSARHAVFRFGARIYLFTLTLICGIRYEVEGLENIPANGAGIVFSKHQSTWETFYLPYIFHDVAIIAKKELVWIPFFGWGLAASEPILINRSNKASAMQQVISKGTKFLKQGRWILVFPEGTRTPAGHVGKYHLGGARLAVATGATVIPVAHNAGYFWPRRKFLKHPGTIRVVIGPAIDTKGRTADEVMKSAKNWIETTVTRIGGLVDEPTR